MADFAYTKTLVNLGLGLANWLTDTRVLLTMTNTTADTDEDAVTIDAIGNLDEFDGTGYPVGFAARSALTGEVVITNNALDRAEWDANDHVWSSLGAGTRQAAGIVVYGHGTSDLDSVPWLWFDSGGFPFTANGSNVTVEWNSIGIALVQNA